MGGASLSPAVRRVTPDGIINTVAGGRYTGFGGDGGPATDASFSSNIKVGLDASANLLIADTFNHRVRRVDSNGVITTIAGNGSGAPVTGVPRLRRRSIAHWRDLGRGRQHLHRYAVGDSQILA